MESVALDSDHGRQLSSSVGVMGFDLEQHMGLDPHVEISREELELGIPPHFFPMISRACKTLILD